MTERPALPIPSLPDDRSVSESEGKCVTELVDFGFNAPFARIVAEHHAWLYRYLYRMTGSTEDAEDLVQETFLRAWRGRKTFRTGRPLKPWLFRIAANIARETLRRSRPRTIPLENRQLPDPRETREARERQHVISQIESLVATFSPDDRELYHLRFGEGLGPSELAPMLGKNEAAVSSAIYRLKERVRRHFSDHQSNSSREKK